MRPEPHRSGPAPRRPATGHPGTAGHRASAPARVPDPAGPPDDRVDHHGGQSAADLAALRAITALARLYNSIIPAETGPDPGHLDRMAVIRDLLTAHLAGGRARRAVTAAPPPHDAPRG